MAVVVVVKAAVGSLGGAVGSAVLLLLSQMERLRRCTPCAAKRQTIPVLVSEGIGAGAGAMRVSALFVGTDSELELDEAWEGVLKSSRLE